MLASLLSLLLVATLMLGVFAVLMGWHRTAWHLFAWAVLLALLLGLAGVGEQAARHPFLRRILSR